MQWSLNHLAAGGLIEESIFTPRRWGGGGFGGEGLGGGFKALDRAAVEALCPRTSGGMNFIYSYQENTCGEQLMADISS